MHSRVVPRATGQNSLNVVWMNGLRASHPDISLKERPTIPAVLIEEIDVTIGTCAINEGRSCVDDKLEPTLRFDSILKSVTGIFRFLTHQPPPKPPWQS